eukprot:scaffold4958_cov145-Skeletonema_marinoi.AAC.20
MPKGLSICIGISTENRVNRFPLHHQSLSRDIRYYASKDRPSNRSNAISHTEVELRLQEVNSYRTPVCDVYSCRPPLCSRCNIDGIEWRGSKYLRYHTSLLHNTLDTLTIGNWGLLYR